MPKTFSEDASGAEKWAKNDHTFFLKHPVLTEEILMEYLKLYHLGLECHTKPFLDSI